MQYDPKIPAVPSQFIRTIYSFHQKRLQFKKTKMHLAILKRIAESVAGLVAVAIFLYFAFQPQGVSSCTADFVNGYASVSEIKEACPNLKKESLINAVEERYHTDNLSNDEELVKINLLNDIEHYFSLNTMNL